VKVANVWNISQTVVIDVLSFLNFAFIFLLVHFATAD